MLTKARRVRTGCFTCKIRRVKCDEQKPSCLRCTKTGRTCDGYDTVGNPNAVRQYHESRTESKIMRPESSLVSTVARRLLPMLPGDHRERQYLTFFRYATAAEFAEYHQITFWDHLILQIVTSEPAACHAVVALAALHKSFEDDNEHALESKRYCIQQYTKAIVGLNTYISAHSCIEVVLVCCILFTSFESIRGNCITATQHLRSGFKIVSYWRQNQSGSKIIQEELVPIFVRLSIQVKSIIGAGSFSDDQRTKMISVSKLFSNLSEARNSLYNIMDRMLDVFSGAQCAKLESSVPLAEVGIVSEGQADSALLLEQWHVAFCDLLTRSRRKMSRKDLNESMLLQIHHTVTFINLNAVNILPKTFDKFLPQFQKIVSLSQYLIKDSAAIFTRYGRKPLCVDMGIIAPLFFTATRCRDPILRREAASILLSPRREGSWDGQAAAGLAESWIVTEEEGLPAVKVAEDVPESSRIRCTELHLFQQESRTASFSFLEKRSTSGRKGVITLTW